MIKASIDESGSKEKGVVAGLDLKHTDKEGIIADCVEQVMEILRSTMER